MKRLIIPFIMLLLCFTACKDKSGSKENSDTTGSSATASMTNEEKIAGNDQKTWNATRETNAEGDKDKLTRDEKKETITFWRNGNVSMSNGTEAMSGQWSYSGTNLSLQFTGSNVSENFTVLELDTDNMKLRAGDGSTLTMKPQ